MIAIAIYQFYNFILDANVVVDYNIYVNLPIPHSAQPSCYHPDNKMIKRGCTGRRIGVPQRIRVTPWTTAHRNYTIFVKFSRVGIRSRRAESLVT